MKRYLSVWLPSLSFLSRILFRGFTLSDKYWWLDESLTIKDRSMDFRVQSALLFTRYWTTTNTWQHDNTFSQVYTVRRSDWSHGIEQDLCAFIVEIRRIFETVWIVTGPGASAGKIVIEKWVVNECLIIIIVFLEQWLRATDSQTCAEEHKTDDNYEKKDRRWFERK